MVVQSEVGWLSLQILQMMAVQAVIVMMSGHAVIVDGAPVVPQREPVISVPLVPTLASSRTLLTTDLRVAKRGNQTSMLCS